jgi:hypothetical protein
LLSAVFQFRGYWLLEPEETACRRAGVIRAYDNAIELATEIQSGDSSGSPFKLSPWAVYMTCLAAAVFISKVVHSSYQSYIDVEAGKRAFNTCLAILRQCSVEDNDLPGRGSRLTVQLWNIHQGQTEEHQKPPTLKLASRMFYSVVYDSMWFWREKYGGLPMNGAPSLPPPFIPTVLVSPNLPSPAQSPDRPTTNLRNKPSENSINMAIQTLPPADLQLPLADVLHTRNPSSSEEPTTAVNEDFDALWDIGFLNPNGMNFGLPLTDFDMATNEHAWLQENENFH